MKTTVLMGPTSRIVVEPVLGWVQLIATKGEQTMTLCLSRDEAGVLCFALEQADEVIEVQQQRAAAGARAADPQPTGQE